VTTDIEMATWTEPPEPCNDEGKLRRVGIELEFAGLGAGETARIVHDLYGGGIHEISDHKVEVRNTELGDFLIELDLRYLHQGDPANPIRKAVGDIAAAVVPMEVACPPLALDRLARLEDLREALRQAGAQGTEVSPLHALGVQLNPELPDLSPETIIAHLRAFLLLREWLRAEIEVDPSRWVLAFATAHPSDYCDLVLSPDYTPDIAGLIDDYLAYNPTRNRELDLLPLCAHLDQDRVRARLPHDKINARPTFHYRLPNAMIDHRDWRIATEWERWVAVERLAARPDLVRRYAARWRENHRHLISRDWTPSAYQLRAALDDDQTGEGA